MGRAGRLCNDWARLGPRSTSELEEVYPYEQPVAMFWLKFGVTGQSARSFALTNGCECFVRGPWPQPHV
jgi:hypothetical protein